MSPVNFYRFSCISTLKNALKNFLNYFFREMFSPCKELRSKLFENNQKQIMPKITRICLITFAHLTYIYTYQYIYVYIYKLAPFSIATTPSYRSGRYSFLWIALLTLKSYLIMLTVKQRGIKFHFLNLWYDSNWTQVCRTVGEHSNHNTKNLCIYRGVSVTLWMTCWTTTS